MNERADSSDTNARPSLRSAGDHPVHLRLSPEQQVAFWEALQAPAKLTPAQERLAALMRGAR